MPIKKARPLLINSLFFRAMLVAHKGKAAHGGAPGEKRGIIMQDSLLSARRAGFSGTALKSIALVLMLLDHIHYFFEFTGFIPIVFTMLGRLAAPLFLFCTVEGFLHTHDRKRYFFRMLAISAPMGLLEFFMMYGGWFNRGDGFYPMNAIFMNFVVLCIVWQGIDWLRAKKWLPGLLAVLIPAVGWPVLSVLLLQAVPVPAMQNTLGILYFTLLPNWMFITDGGWGYLLGGVILYLFHGNRKLQLSVWVIWTFWFEFIRIFMLLRGTDGFVWTQMFTDYFQWFEIFSVLLMALYNGQRGSGHKSLFYWFYPVHVYVLYGASCLLYTALH